jgi:hypothetical protein
MVKIKLQLKDIPKIDSPPRRHLLRFTGEKFYQKEIEEGIPFFSDNDLNALEEKYKDGMTKKDLISEIHKRGWQIKESTIKSYISKGLIPRALKRVKTNKGMESIYPSDTIRHLNFTRYCLFSEDYSIKLLLSGPQDEETNDLDLLLDASTETETDTGDGIYNDCFEPYELGFSQISDTYSNWASESIRKAFSGQPNKCDLYLSKLKEADDAIIQAERKFYEFKKLLGKNSTPSNLVNLDFWKTLRELFGKLN